MKAIDSMPAMKKLIDSPRRRAMVGNRLEILFRRPDAGSSF
jgi:hypothetical protein